MSSASKGQYYKAKTKKYYEGLGYQVAFLERMMFLHTKRGMVPIKRDQFGADLLAVSESEILFIQVKGGVSAMSNRAAGVKEFAKYRFPAFSKQLVVLWTPRKRAPDILDCSFTVQVGTAGRE